MMNEQTSFYVTGGTLKFDARSYVERRADRELFEAISKGKFCYVLTSRQMGKSSLMVRTAARLRQLRFNVIILDLTQVGRNLTAEQWYDGLLFHIGQQMNLEAELNEFWNEHLRLGPMQRLMSAIREVLLPRCRGRLVIFIDEVDTVLSLSFPTDEFFAGIRELNNRQAEDEQMRRLSFCLLGVATPTELIQDVRMTPFNIGLRIELTDFTDREARVPMRGLECGLNIGDRVMRRILYWTGGHPYLTQRLCLAWTEVYDNGRNFPSTFFPGVLLAEALLRLKNMISSRGGASRLVSFLDGILTKVFRTHVEYVIDEQCDNLFLSKNAQKQDTNLLFVRNYLIGGWLDLNAVLSMYGDLVKRMTIPVNETDATVNHLRLSGVARLEEGRLTVRNRIYQSIFDARWVEQNLGNDELERQRAAYRRGSLRATLIVLVISLGLVLLTGQSLSSVASRNATIRVGEENQTLRRENERLRTELNEIRAQTDTDVKRQTRLAQELQIMMENIHNRSRKRVRRPRFSMTDH